MVQLRDLLLFICKRACDTPILHRKITKKIRHTQVFRNKNLFFFHIFIYFTGFENFRN